MNPQKTAPTFVEDLMTGDMLTMRVSDPPERARDLMLSLGIHAIPLLDDDGAVAGIVTSHDLVDDQLDDDANLEELMSSPVVTINCEATVQEAAELMRSELIHHLIVLEDGDPVGILSTFDLLRVIAS